MVSNRCKMIVKEELNKLGLHFIFVELGVADVMENIPSDQMDQLCIALKVYGLEIMEDKKAITIEKIKNVIVEMIHHTEEMPNVNFSQFLSEKLHLDYTYLSNLFSEVLGTTIEQYIISHKVERIKELIIYNELNLTQISYKMNYSSVAHLSTQFKKVTGLSPSHFKQLKDKYRCPLEDVGILSTHILNDNSK